MNNPLLASTVGSVPRFAAVQMNSGADVAANLAQMERQVRAAAAAGACLVVLPENFALLAATQEARLAIAEPEGTGAVQHKTARLAAELGIWLVAGTIPVVSDDPLRPTATCFVYDDRGDIAGRYDKIHLFDVSVPGSHETYVESSFTASGSAALVVATPWGRLGVAVCYDLRFPELFREMSGAGLDFIALPAAFTVATGAAHWEVLLRARAIENLCYVVAAAQAGVHPGNRSTWGHSMIVDPWGVPVATAGSEPGPVVAGIDMARMARIRVEFPVLGHRRE